MVYHLLRLRAVTLYLVQVVKYNLAVCTSTLCKCNVQSGADTWANYCPVVTINELVKSVSVMGHFKV